MSNLFRFVRLANAHNDHGPDGLKSFNTGYLAGLAGILLAWNSAGILKVTISDGYVLYTAACLEKTLESKHYSHLFSVAIVMLSLCFVFVVIISRRKNIYLSKLQDSHICNLPAKNALTYIDTLMLFSILSGSFIYKILCILFWTLDILSFGAMNFAVNIMSICVDDIGVGFIFQTKHFIITINNIDISNLSLLTYVLLLCRYF